MAFRKKVRIYFDQGDPAHIAFHGQHTVIIQRVMEEYVESLGIPWKEWYDSKELFLPVAGFNIQFKKPLYPGKEYTVKIQFVSIGRTSVKTEGEILSLQNEDLCCSVSAAYVCVKSDTFQPRPFPEHWIPLLKKAVTAS